MMLRLHSRSPVAGPLQDRRSAPLARAALPSPCARGSLSGPLAVAAPAARPPRAVVAGSLILPRAAKASSSASLAAAEAALPTETARVAVVGSGPAAHSAAIYLARAELSPLVLEGTFQTASGPGGQLTTTTRVENYPGFPGGIDGYELCERFRAQSAEHGARLLQEKVYRVDFSGAAARGRGGPLVLYTEERPGVPLRRVEAEAVVVATGAAARRLPIPGAGEGAGGYWQKGVSACAVCDGALFRGGHVAVVGGGDTAMEEALFLSRFAESVTVVHRFPRLEASAVMARRARGNPKVHFLLESEVVALAGDGASLQRATVRDTSAAGAGREREIALDALFFGVGHSPCVEFLDGQLRLDEAGYIWTEPGTSRTSVSGVFAAGDVADRRWRQAVTAAGSGCVAALEAERLLGARDAQAAGGGSRSSAEEEEGDNGPGGGATGAFAAAAREQGASRAAA